MNIRKVDPDRMEGLIFPSQFPRGEKRAAVQTQLSQPRIHIESELAITR